MRGTCELRTERLLLRRYRAEDAAVLHEKFGGNRRMSRYSGWDPYATRELAEETVRSYLARYGDVSFYAWIIEHEGDLIGTVGAYDWDRKRGSIEVGLSIQEASWGRGFATEALRRVLTWLTESEGVPSVRAWCAAENAGSRKAMLRAGMTQTGTEAGGLTVEGRTYDRLLFEYRAGRSPGRRE